MHLRALIPSLVISIFAGAHERDRRRLAELRQNWGKEISRERKLDIIALYHFSAGAKRRTVDDRTWQDLGLDELFAKIDHTAGIPGQQVLYHQLRTYEEDDRVLAERARQQAVFKDDQPLREKCQVLLARLNGFRSGLLASSLLAPFPETPRFAPLLYLCSFLSLTCLVGMVFVHWLFLPLLALMLVNVGITGTYGRRVTPSFSGFSQIAALLGVAGELATIADRHSLPQLAAVRKAIPLLGRLRSRLGWLVMDRSTLPDLAESALAYVNPTSPTGGVWNRKSLIDR
jgi:hypothetical protein